MGNGGVGGARECCIAAAIFSFLSDRSEMGWLEERGARTDTKPEETVSEGAPQNSSHEIPQKT